MRKQVEKNNILVSVIIPIYNSQEYLCECLESVVNQTLKEIEIICVNDGSTDNSLNILKEYSKNDKRIKILEQENSSAGQARNAGKATAKGKYIVFWDSDDYFKLPTLEKMYLKCLEDDADICVCAGRQYYHNTKISAPFPRLLRKTQLPKDIPFNINTSNDYILNFTNVVVWNKMFKRSFIEDNNLNFKETRNHNDVFFVENALCLAEKISVVTNELVYYRKNKDSGLIATLSLGLLDALNTWIETAESLRNKNVFPEKSFANIAMENIIYLFNNTNDWDKYVEGFKYLQSGNLERLAIKKDIDNYYYVDYYYEVANRLYTNTPEEYAKWIWRYNYLQKDITEAKERIAREKARNAKSSYEKNNRFLNEKIQALQDEVNSVRKENETIKSSTPYKIIKTLTLFLKRIKNIFKFS